MRFWHIGVSVLLGIMIVGSSVFWTSVRVENKVDLENVRLGFPFAFMIQDQTRYDPPFPYRVSFYSPWENPTSVDGVALLASIALMSGVVLIPAYAISRITRNYYRRSG